MTKKSKPNSGRKIAISMKDIPIGECFTIFNAETKEIEAVFRRIK